MVEVAGPLNRERVRALLESHGFDPDSYALNGGHPVERYVLDHRAGEWIVYYSERGLETEPHTFESEDLACRHFIDRIWRDPTTRKQS